MGRLWNSLFKNDYFVALGQQKAPRAKQASISSILQTMQNVHG